MARRRSPGGEDPKSLRRTIIEILLGGGLLAAAIPVAQKYFDGDDGCDGARRAIDAIRRADDLSPELRVAYIRHMQRQLKIAEQCDREAGR